MERDVEPMLLHGAIELFYEGWMKFEAESLYVREGYGFAAKFVDLPEDTRARLESVIWRLMSKSPSQK